MSTILAIDQGTSGTKAIVGARDGLGLSTSEPGKGIACLTEG